MYFYQNGRTELDGILGTLFWEDKSGWPSHMMAIYVYKTVQNVGGVGSRDQKIEFDYTKVK